MIQVQVRVPEKMIEMLDTWIKEGRYTSRSDAIRTIVGFHQELERTREFYRMLSNRSRETREHPDELIPLE